MAEFPHFEHCAHVDCNRLDFLPMKCGECNLMFCSKHFAYNAHHCSSGFRSDVQVPVCPLCNKPVPTAKHESADIVVGAHIDNDCQSDPARRKRAYVNMCSLKRCKRREVVPILCNGCRRNFCVAHRHTDDHECTGTKLNPLLRPLGIANKPIQKQACASESTKRDEELARSLQSMWNDSSISPEELDARLAAQLQSEEYRQQYQRDD